MATADELLPELGRIQEALIAARVYVAGHDQADSARQTNRLVAYSPLRTLIEQAEKSAERVAKHLSEAAAQPPNGHDGTPL